ncbi:MAG: hypothetical protein HYY25_16995 [Candidatus Wallbacteria bacterium]|nr:hypothetical protein [Candidatus Wallbacteria bacterium]
MRSAAWRWLVLAEASAALMALAVWAACLQWTPSEELRAELERDFGRQVRELEERIEEVRAVLHPLDARRLAEPELPRFLSTLSERAASCGFELDLLTPGGIRRAPGSSVAEVELAFTQPFTNVVSYLRSLRTIPHLFGIQKLSLLAPSEDSPPSGAMALRAELTLSVLLESAAESPRSTGAGSHERRQELRQ